MPHPCPHHCPGGNSGTGTAVLVILAVAVAAAIARPVVHAAETVLEVALYVTAGLASCAVLAAVAYAAWRIRRRRMTRLALPAATARAIPAPSRRQISAPAQYHHVHLHGLSDAQLSAITTRQGITRRPRIEKPEH